MTTEAKGTSLWYDAWLRLKHNRAAMIGLFVIILIGITCVVLPSIGDFLEDPNKTDPINRNLQPGAENWFGTDHLGATCSPA